MAEADDSIAYEENGQVEESQERLVTEVDIKERRQKGQVFVNT